MWTLRVTELAVVNSQSQNKMAFQRSVTESLWWAER